MQHIVIAVNKSVTIPVSRPFSSAVVGSPEIADALPMTDRALYIQAKKIGTTNVSIYDENMRLIKVVDVEVAFDTGNLQSKIRASTGNTGIRVGNDNGQVVLSGTASDAVTADKAFNLAKAWAPNGTVINAMNVASPQQVMLKVRFLEVARTAGRQLGINWAAINGSGTRGVTTGQGGLVTSPPQIGGTQNVNGTPTVTCSIGHLPAIRQWNISSGRNIGRLECRRTIWCNSGRNRQQGHPKLMPSSPRSRRRVSCNA